MFFGDHDHLMYDLWTGVWYGGIWKFGSISRWFGALKAFGGG